MALAVARRGAEEVLADADVGSEGGLDDAFEAFPQGIGVEEVWVGQGDVAMLDLVAEDVEEEGDEVLFVMFGEFADLSRNLVPWITGVSISCIWGPSTLKGQLTGAFRTLHRWEQDIPNLEPLFNPVHFLILLTAVSVQFCPLGLVNAFLQRGRAKLAGLLSLAVISQFGQTLCTVTSIPGAECLFASLALHR